MATLVRPHEPTTTDAPAAPERAGRGRIAGIDIARAVALIGMFTVHVSIYDEASGAELGGVAGWWLTAPSGRASVLFMLLAGTSLSLIHRRGAASAAPAAVRRRGLALLVGGLLLSATVWPASILEHYGTLFLIAPWLLVLRTRTLAAVTFAAVVVGPIIALAAPTIDLAGLVDGPVASWTLSTIESLWLDGTYPLIVWFGIFCCGLLLGRIDLRSGLTAKLLIGGGLAAVVAVNLVVAGFSVAGVIPDPPYWDVEESAASIGEFDDSTFDDGSFEASGFEGSGFEGSELEDSELGDSGFERSEFGDSELGDSGFEKATPFDDASLTGPADPVRNLLDTSPHSGRTAWMVESLGIAAAILGLALMARGRLLWLLRPLAMLGSISLTAYLVHIVLVGDVFDNRVAALGLAPGAQFAILVGLQLFLVVLAVGIRSRWRQGPFEWLLKQMTAAGGRPAPAQ